MAETTFEDFVASERERLNNERAALWDQQHELEQKLEAIDRELKAINAYVATKEGRPLPQPGSPTGAPQERRARAPRDPDAPRRTRGDGGVRPQVLELVRRAGGDGITSGDLVVTLQMDDKAGRQAVANALQALKKDGAVRQAGRRQPYVATENPGADEEDPAADDHEGV